MVMDQPCTSLQKYQKSFFSHLQSKGFVSLASVNDSYLQGNTYKACLNNIENTIEL